MYMCVHMRVCVCVYVCVLSECVPVGMDASVYAHAHVAVCV